MKKSPLIVVGAGLFGLTLARELSSKANMEVTIIEKRNHVGGNAYSYVDPATGLEVHKYGAHIFHTDSFRIWDYATKISPFRSYDHRVLAHRDGEFYPFPINLQTIGLVRGEKTSPVTARKYLHEQGAGSFRHATNFREQAINTVGRELYELFFRDYTQKQWNTDPESLPRHYASRIPLRLDYGRSYFTDEYVGLPASGYADWISSFLPRRVKVFLETDYLEISGEIDPAIPVVFTGPLDAYFKFKHGSLGWRTVDFELETVRIKDGLPSAVVNETNSDNPCTRRHDFSRYLEDYKGDSTVVAHEYSRFAGSSDEPYYPVNTPKDRQILKQYIAEIENLQRVRPIWFGGRLGSYKYLDMHMAMASALTMSDRVWSYISRLGC
ncbi:UDP-galactopyranose mutase [Streptomyces sp. NPDC058286]|uniref:UDP-galactopyranose/dTDP-fucopyranose mutase family protein n=1 Tax=Streptomyces sp. NPDC058286 TaxID=3346422 RepID=UPI0036EA3D40